MQPGNLNARRRIELGRGQKRESGLPDEVRICCRDGCDTRLSAYNESDYCYRHRSDLADPPWGR